MEPKIRFKGFEGQWKAEVFQNSFDPLRNNSLSRAELADDGNIANIHYGDVLIKYTECIDTSVDKLTYILDNEIGKNLVKNGALKRGDIIFADAAEDNTVGKCSELLCKDDELIVSGLHTIACRPRLNVAEKYLGYYLNSPAYHNQLLPHIQGTKISSISKKAINTTSVVFPTQKSEQKAIASYFTSLDSQISASTSRLASLKQMKAASLQAMFPQEGETVPKIRFKGFEGEWNISRLGDFSTSFSGGTPTAGVAEFYGGEIPFIRSGEIHENRTELFLTEAGINNSSAKVVEKGTLLYALYGATSGEVGISKIKGAINQAILAIYPNKSVNKIFLSNYLQLKKQRIVGEFLQGGQGNLSGALVKSILVTYPSLAEQQAIASYFTSLDHQISLQSQRLEKLKQIKSACLDKMFV